MPLELTAVGYRITNDDQKVLGSISYDCETNKITLTKGDNGDSITFRADHLKTLQTLLKEMEARIFEVFE